MKWLRGLLAALTGILLLLLSLYYWPSIRSQEWVSALINGRGSSLEETREQMLAIRDSMAQLDFRIRDADSNAVQGLQKEQREIWELYQNLREQIVVSEEKHSRQASHGVNHRALILSLVLGAIAIAVLGFLIRISLRKKSESGSKEMKVARPFTPSDNSSLISHFDEALDKKNKGELLLTEALKKINSIRLSAKEKAKEPGTEKIPISIQEEHHQVEEFETEANATIEKEEIEILGLDEQVKPRFGQQKLIPPKNAKKVRSANDLFMEDYDDQNEKYAASNEGAEEDLHEFEAEDQKRAEVLKLARRGLTASEISRRLRVSQDQVEVIIRLHREKG